MVEQRFDVGLDVEGQDAVVRAAGDLDLASVPRLDAVLEEAFGVGADVARVVVDASAIEFIDSSGLTALVKAHRRAGEAGLRMVVRDPSERVRRTFALTRLDGVFEIE